MWSNFPRLGFTSTVVYTVQKSFYTSKFFLFLIFFIYGKWSLLGPGGAAFDVSNALFLHIFAHEICLYETESNISHPVCVIFKPYPPRSFSSVRAYVWLYHAYSNTLFFIANKILLARQRKSSSCSFLLFSVSLFAVFHLLSFYPSVLSWRARSGDILRIWQRLWLL